uniref:rhodopsin kinase GRK7-like n=1 Tax=Myxine glutinosa TaxID=7769 RepID=UPI00358FC2A4
LGGLDNLIANTAYLQARRSVDAGVGGSKCRRRLALPGLAKCMEIRQLLRLSFASECEEQPIGRRLFRAFATRTFSQKDFGLFSHGYSAMCLKLPDNIAYGGHRNIKVQTAPHSMLHWIHDSPGLTQMSVDLCLTTCGDMNITDKVGELELAEENMHNSLLCTIVADFLQPESENFLLFLSDAISAASGTPEVDMKDLVLRAQQETREFLMGKPFREYLESPFFQRFLQWKALEQQKITEKHFYEFRVLGKGGFGEVSSCPSEADRKMHACKKLNKKSLKNKKGQKMALLEKEILESVNSSMV